MTPVQALFSPTATAEDRMTRPAFEGRGASNHDGNGDFSAEPAQAQPVNAANDLRHPDTDQRIRDADHEALELTPETLMDEYLTADDNFIDAVPPYDPVAEAVEGWTGISGAIRNLPSQHEPEADMAAADEDATVPPAANRPAVAAIETKASATAITEPVSLTATTAEVPRALPQAELSLATPSQPAATEMTQTAANRLPPSAIVQQVAEAMVRMKGDRIEIALSPEELGRLRMVIGRQNGAPHIHIWAERPEILDLMRRHTDLLSEQFGQDGMGTPSFSFSNTDSGQQEAAPSADESVRSDAPESVILAVQVAGFRSPPGDRRLDIRL